MFPALVLAVSWWSDGTWTLSCKLTTESQYSKDIYVPRLLVFIHLSRGETTAIIAWCNSVDVRDIVELKTEADFNECKNLPRDPIIFDSEGGLDGVLVRKGPKSRYFVERSSCAIGWKIMIDFN